MSRLGTFRHLQHSIFQSLIEDVTQRIERREGHGSEASAHRKTVGDPSHDVAHHIVRQQLSGDRVSDTPPDALRQQHGSKLESLWVCAKLTAELCAAAMTGDRKQAESKLDELRFAPHDPMWAKAALEYLDYFGPDGGRRKIPYVRHRNLDDFVIETLPSHARVALVGDWGSGTVVARQLLDQITGHQPDVLIHLGDVYYAGTEHENRVALLDPVESILRRDGKKIPVYNLSGNHDMFSGGVGFYRTLPKLNPPPDYAPEQGQQASYFCLRSIGGGWQFLAMDTGLHDHDLFGTAGQLTYLEASEEAWHVDKIERFSAAGGRTVLLSHHQLFSGLQEIGDPKTPRTAGEQAANPKLLASWRKFQQAAKGGGDAAIAAWFWGHEHNLSVYQPYLGLERGRCIGHGALPIYARDNPYDHDLGIPDPPRLVDDPRQPGQPLQLDVVDQVFAHGFVILDLDDDQRTATASYYQETDTAPMFVERF